MKKVILFLALIWGTSFAASNSAIGIWFQGSTNNHAEWWGVNYKRSSSNVAMNVYGNLGYESNASKFTAGLYYGHYFLINAIKADASAGKFPLHWGPYGGLGFWSQSGGSGVAARGGVTGGISWILPELPIDISFELTPVIECNFTEDGLTFHDLPISFLHFKFMLHYYF